MQTLRRGALEYTNIDRWRPDEFHMAADDGIDRQYRQPPQPE